MTDLRRTIVTALMETSGMNAREQAIRSIAALTAAGFHILSDADLQARDDAVLEKAAEVPGTFHQMPDDDEEPGDDTWWARKARNGCLARVAAAIRAMQGGKS